MHTNRRWLSLAVAGALALGSAPAYADPDDDFTGTYALEGEYSTGRHTAADLTVTWTESGDLAVERTGRFTSFRFRNVPPFTWTGSDVAVVGSRLEVTYRVALDGTTATASGDDTGLAGALEGALAGGTVGSTPTELRAGPGTNHPALATLPAGTELRVLGHAARSGQGAMDWLEVEATVDGAARRGFVVAKRADLTQGVNVFRATYTLDDGRLSEVVTNTTRLTPEHFWAEIRTTGPRLSGPDAHTARIRLGGELEVQAGGSYTVVVPTDGSLTLKVSAGTLTLSDPQGAAVNAEPAATVEHEVPHESPVLGIYTIAVSDDADGATLTARFVQKGRIDTRIRPWSSHTYYPVYEGTDNNLFHEGGPLEKFDQVLGLEDGQSAVWWERGTDYRTGFGFERGHYTKTRSIREEKAEAHWFADLNADGIIETADVTSATYFARFDTNEDGLIDDDEAHTRFKEGVIKAVWNTYDTNYNGKVESSEISANFVSQHDADGSGDIDSEEWAEALRRSFQHVLTSRSADAVVRFMRQDIDEDGKLNIDELDPPGAIDFMDSSDVDGDYNDFFDRDNIAVVSSGTTHYGNKLVEDGDTVKLFKGYDKDELVVELSRDQVTEIKHGVADGDIDDSYSIGWWGHCNAWSLAAIVFRKPSAEFEKDGVTLTVRDQKGLLVELGMGDTEDSTFWWTQWGGRDIPPDRYAQGFHEQIHRWLRVNQKGMMADMDLKNPKKNLNFAVWNYPLLGYEAELKEAEGDDPYVVDVRCTLEKGSYSDEDSSSTASVRYRLHFDAQGRIRTGDENKTEWAPGTEADSKEYIRYLVHPYRFTSRGDSGNPNVTMERLEQVFGEHLKYNSLEDLEAEEAAAAASGLPGTPGE